MIFKLVVRTPLQRRLALLAFAWGAAGSVLVNLLQPVDWPIFHLLTGLLLVAPLALALPNSFLIAILAAIHGSLFVLAVKAAVKSGERRGYSVKQILTLSLLLLSVLTFFAFVWPTGEAP